MTAAIADSKPGLDRHSPPRERNIISAPRSERATNRAQHRRILFHLNIFRIRAMQQDSGIQFQDLDQVLRHAQLRRSADLSPWLRQRFSPRAGRFVIATSLACVVVALTIVAAPRPVSSAALGSDWQCSKAAFVLTTCRQIAPAHS
ncbi:hypothetical protein [Bradyrhizobium sp. USDA 4454]